MFGESDGADVDLAETEPWKDDRSGDDAVEPESGVVLAGVGEGLTRLATVVDEENNQGPNQCQSSPSEETVGPFEGIVELVAHAGVGKCEHYQKEAQNYPGDDNGGKGDLCRVLAVLLRSGLSGTYGRQAMDVFTSAHSDEENQPDGSGNTTAGVHWRIR